DVDSVCDVEVLKAGAARDGRVSRSGAAARGNAGRRIEQPGDTASHGDGLVEGVRQIGRNSGRRSVYRDRASGDFNRFRLLTRDQCDAEVGGFAGDDLDAFGIGRFEAALFNLQAVKARGEQGE